LNKSKGKKIISYVSGDGEIHQQWSKYDEKFDDEKGYLFWCNKNHVKSFVERPLPKDLTWAEKGRINELKNYMLTQNQLLVYRGHGCIKPITDNEICKILDMSLRQSKAFIKKVKDFGVIKEIEIDGITYLAFNPIYALKTKRISLTMYIIFQKELNTVLPAWVIEAFTKQAKELNPIVKIIK